MTTISNIINGLNQMGEEIHKLKNENDRLRKAIKILGERTIEFYPDDLQKWSCAVLNNDGSSQRTQREGVK